MFRLSKFINYRKNLSGICTKHLKLYTMNCSFSSIQGNSLKAFLQVKGLAEKVSVSNRSVTTSFPTFSEGSEIEEVSDKNDKPEIDPRKDRTKVIPPETSIRYMKSEAYKITYGDEPVWVKYRRNFKGQFVPRRTRESCVRKGVITTGNPCPICRDEYLVLDYTNVELLKQFISPYTGDIIDPRKTHVCRKQLLKMEVAIKKARFYGYLTYQVPFRSFNYSDYYPNCKQ